MAGIAGATRRWGRKKGRVSIRIGVVVATAAVIWLTAIVSWTRSPMPKPLQRADAVVSPQAMFAADRSNILDDLWPDDMDNEQLLSSLHSCLVGEAGPVSRIGVLYPPGSISSVVVRFTELMATTHVSKEPEGTTWVPTSHLPSSSAYSHIIRFANLPIILSVGDALLSVASAQEIAWKDVHDTTILILDWHCYVSAIADEEERVILTITLDQLEKNAVEQEDSLLETILVSEDSNEEEEAKWVSDLEKHLTKTVSTAVEQVAPMLKAVDQEYRKDPLKNPVDLNLEGMVSRIVQEYLKGEEVCPEDLRVFSDEMTPLTRRVYNFMKPLETDVLPALRTDQELCVGDTDLATQSVCRTLAEPFSTDTLAKK